MSAMEHEKDILMEEKQIQEDKLNSKAETYSSKKSHERKTRSRQKKNSPRPRPRRMEEKSFSESQTDGAESLESDEPTVEPALDTDVPADAEQCLTEYQHQADDMELEQTEIQEEVVDAAPSPEKRQKQSEESQPKPLAEEPLDDEAEKTTLNVVQEEAQPAGVQLENEIPEESTKNDEKAGQKKGKVTRKKEKEVREKKHHFAFYMGWFTLAFTLCSALLIVALFLFSGNPLFTTAEDVELPNFTQMTREDVETNPAYSSFKLQFEEEYNDEVKAGVIFDQSPKPPKNVKENSSITLFVSKGVEYVEIPDVSGWKRETAREKLKELGVEVLIRYEQSEEVDTDMVLRTDPAAGETVQTGTTVSLYVSQQETLKESQVPSCVGKSQAEATSLLMERKLKVKIVRRDSSSAKGTVLGQSPQPGILLNSGDTVTLYVSNGEPEVPDVTETGHVHSWSPPDENGYQFCYVCLEKRKAPQ